MPEPGAFIVNYYLPTTCVNASLETFSSNASVSLDGIIFSRGSKMILMAKSPTKLASQARN